MRMPIALLLLVAPLAGCDSQPAKAPTATASTTPVPPPLDSRDPRKVLVAWAKAVSLKQWDEAYGYFGDGAGLTLEQFRADWGKLSQPELEIREGKASNVEGGLRYTAPVALIDGERRVSGLVVMRKANQWNAASPHELHWRIERTTLAP